MANSPSRLAPSDVIERLRAQFGDDVLGAEDSFGHAAVAVALSRYREVVAMVRDDPAIACDFFDYTTAVDRKDHGFEVVSQMTSSTTSVSVRVKTVVDAENPVCPTVFDIYPGAEWHERETWELFGVVFEGHPHLVKLLLPEEFEGYPLRKSFELMSRVAKPWPGDQEIPD